MRGGEVYQKKYEGGEVYKKNMRGWSLSEKIWGVKSIRKNMRGKVYKKNNGQSMKNGGY